jgi:hypothetical protein
MRRAFVALLLVAALASPSSADEPRSYVDLPLQMWMQLVARPRHGPPPAEPPDQVVYLERRLEGAFHHGLLSATLATRFEVLSTGGHVRVPILDADAAPGRVRLDGKATSLVEVDGMYTVGIEGPGVHVVEVTFHLGEEQDRFTRRLEATLPAGGVTRLALLVPETDIDAQLTGGTLTAATRRPGGTMLEGYLDASGKLELEWTRRVALDRAKGPGKVSLEAHARALYTIEETLVDASVVVDLDVLEGELDRVELALPPDVEITEVTGDAVLQFLTTGSALTVLLRYPVDDHAAVTVRFRYPTAPGAPAPLELPRPAGDVPCSGTIGVRALAGLDVQVARVEGAKPLGVRELPAALTDMSATPVRLGFSFDAPPAIALAVTRLAQVELTSTLIDDIEASTVFLEDGSEMGKLRLSIRNNTRQYLRVRLPGGATLSHALLDGHPVRPALGHEQGRDVLLFSLRQSERIDPSVGRTHRVRPGDTLRQIAHLYYSDPDKSSLILEANRRLLSDAEDLRPGQELVIPSAGTVTVEESSFVLELAYQRHGARLGLLGTAELVLPELDVDALKVTWHVYAPDAVVPLDFEANLTQQSGLRYDTLRRLQRFLDEALGGGKAWAGEGYKSILAQRRGIYAQAAVERGGGEASPTAFPLVGQRFRFKRILIDHEQPRISFFYVSRGLAAATVWAALLAAFGLATWALRPRPTWRRGLAIALGGVALLVLGHYLLGVHRRLVWGVDVALVVELVRLRRARGPLGLRALAWSPWTLTRWFTVSNLLVLVALAACVHVAVRFPMFLSLLALVVLARAWQRSSGVANVA